MKVRSVSFDTSFLLNKNPNIDKVIKILSHDFIPCFITTTVLSELEQLMVWGRISKTDYKKAIKRTKKTKTKIIDFKNRLLSDTFAKECVASMEEHHGVESKNIVNDCNILVQTLKNGVDIFLSQDFHFTSKITRSVIEEVSSQACTEYQMMCETNLYSIDAETFLESYKNKEIDTSVINSRIKSIKKDGKRL